MKTPIHFEHSKDAALAPKLGPIVLACDERYAMPLAVTIRSVVEANHQDWPISFFVLVSDMSDHSRKRITDSMPSGSACIEWIHIDLKSFSNFATQSYISNITFARLRIADLLANISGRVLYLDSDILVLSSLRPFWAADLSGAALGATLDSGIDAMIKRKDPRLDLLPRVRKYFNAGVLLIDLNRWRQERVAERALEYLLQYPKSPYSDQDALNVACDGRWENVGDRWNYQVYRHLPLVTDIAPELRPAVVHFVMSNKPWRYNVLNDHAPLYDSFRARTIFARTFMEKLPDGLRTLWGRLKREFSRLRTTHTNFHS